MLNHYSHLAHNEPLLRDLQVFCEVARRASFIAAATACGLSPAYVSKRIATLETHLGVRLFNRTTRRVAITREGEAAYQWARAILENVESMFDALQGTASEPKGVIRVCASLRLGRVYVAPILALIRQQHPGIDVWLELLDRRADLLSEAFDIDIRVGEVHEPHLIAHRVAPGQRIVAAAPAYLARRGTPRAVAELAQHDCLLFRDREQSFGVWRLDGPSGQETVKVTGPMASNHSDIVREWACAGFGVIMASSWDIAGHLAEGALVQLLPQHSQRADIWAVTAARASHSAKVSTCVRLLQAHLAEGPYALPTITAANGE